MDLSPNFTPRYRVKYQAVGRSHVTTFRVLPSASEAERASVVSVLLAELSPFLYAGWSILGADYAEGGSDVFLPTLAPAGPATSGDSPSSGSVPAFASFGRKSLLGNRTRIYVYGWKAHAVVTPNANDYRLTPAEVPGWSDILDALSNSIFCGPDLAATVVDPYINVGYSAYYQRRQRG